MKQKILIIDDETDVHYSFKRLLEKEPFEVISANSGGEGLKIVKKEKPDVVVMDIRMGTESGLDTLRELRRFDPKQIVIMMTAYGTSQTAIEAMKLGAFDYILKPFDIEHLHELLRRALIAAQAMREKVKVLDTAEVSESGAGIVGHARGMQTVYKLIGQVAPTEATVLIAGESGTGKELVARAIYSNSGRANKTYMAINCAAIPENLLESELFGHERGAFTGAAMQRIGKFEQCDGGTLFLDEIGDMPIGLQAKLLRVLQDGEIFRVGSNAPIRTNVRIIAATNHDLLQAVKKKEFREDLYYRLNVVTIPMPPLRDRREDIPVLTAYFVKKWRAKKTESKKISVSAEAMQCLQDYAWHGNVRELENCVQRALVLSSGDSIHPSHLPVEIRAGTPHQISKSEETKKSGAIDLSEAIRAIFDHARKNPKFPLLPSMEREFVAYALEETNGNLVQAAKLLGITRSTLRKRIEKFGISKKIKIDLS
ncbi:MAG: sigma 54-interacting transcriptional regulator [Verrucomicrobiota bacterium]